MIEMLALTSVAHMKQVEWVQKVIAKLCNLETMIFLCLTAVQWGQYAHFSNSCHLIVLISNFTW